MTDARGGDAERAIDPELGRLLLEEINRHAPSLDDAATDADLKRVAHALKGSAAIAGARALAEMLARLERRLAAGDRATLGIARERIADVARALAEGAPLPGPAWPEPPEDLRAEARANLEGRYAAEMLDRLDRLDRALVGGDDVSAAAAAFREVHAMKGAALAALDEVTAWFCHGLESRLRAGEKSEAEARRALAELARWRGVLAETITSPERALETLRVLAAPSRATSAPPTAPAAPLPLPPRRPKLDSAEPIEREDASLRVPTATLDRLLERARLLGEARSRVSDGASLVGETAARARDLQLDLMEALRLIGPPRPWGAPAAAIQRIDGAARAFAELADRLERKGAALREAAGQIRGESSGLHGDLAAIRTTKIGALFERVAAAVLAQARREGREVRVAFAGEDTPVDRRVAEILFDPLLQLARNAVVHGVEDAAERAARGKPRVGTIELRAQARSGGLRVVVHDDGVGVNVADVRIRAIATGTISADVARAADDATLLALLFVPGFTTRDSADLLAGRGVGLDLALDVVHRLGGTIRLASQPGLGLRATIDVPFEPGLVRVLWVEAGDTTFALPAQHARRVALTADIGADRVTPLATCIASSRPAQPTTPRLAIELEPPREGSPTPYVGVDRVGAVEEVALRGVSAIVTAAGPFAGAVVRGSELRLCLDAHALAEICHARAR